jgi:hypothetical protein
MNEEAFRVFAQLSGQQMAETERVVNSVIEGLQNRIDDLEMENAALRMKIERLSGLSLFDLADNFA